jgi:alpha-galactosidase
MAVGNASAFDENSKEAMDMGIRSSIKRPIKVVFLGAGSMFLYQLFKDALNMPGVDGHMALVDIDEERLDLAVRFCHHTNKVMGRNWKISATTDRRKALKGADYIINCIEVSGVQTVAFDNDIPMKYGIGQAVGDTMGPGGLFKALRTVPVFLEELRDVEKLCPNALFLNYTNPMSTLCLAARRAFPHLKVIGLCHSVQATSSQLSGYLGIDYRQLKWQVGGINHLAWFTELSHNGKDLYPRLKQMYAQNPEKYKGETVRMDVMTHLGYFVTESSIHLSEYLPYYRKRKDTFKKYCPTKDYMHGWYSTNWPAWRGERDKHREDLIAGKEGFVKERSHEYATFMIQAMETNDPFIVHVNMPNHGFIPNLPADGVVEVPCVVDQNGVTPMYFGNLPPQCAALCRNAMGYFDLAAEACLQKSKEIACHALMLDPLCAAVSTPAEIRKMTMELFDAEKAFLPGYK